MSLSAAAHDRFWPASFAERGATVPFTTPLLAAARLRTRDGKDVEFLVPGLSGTKGIYVLSGRSRPEMFLDSAKSESTAPYSRSHCSCVRRSASSLLCHLRCRLRRSTRTTRCRRPQLEPSWAVVAGNCGTR